MNKKNKATDRSAPYRTLGMSKVSAPNKAQNEPKAGVIKTNNDLRMRGNKA